MKRSAANIILVGFSGTGKSAAARETARRLGWQPIDTDDVIVKETGKAITDIFAELGEKKFREIERKVLREACQGERRVVATGGGAVTVEENHNLLKESGVVVRLEASTANIIGRLGKDAAYVGKTAIRPLLVGDDALEKIERLKAEREPYYAVADTVINTDRLTLDDVCQEIIRDWQEFSRAQEPGPQQRIAAEVRTATEHYRIIAGWGVLDTIGDRMHQLGLTGKTVVISDANVHGIYGNRVKSALEGAHFKVVNCVVPPGEASKSFEQAARIFDFLVANRVERSDTIVALGGGMVGDLAGYVAAGYMRGIPYVQAPTSLIGMVDASIGGKVAVNHPQGKNLVGAFYQPKFVLTDAQTLTTLPKRELTSGWAEVIKHGLILDPGLFELLRARAGELLKLNPALLVEAVARSAAVKARVVSEDEKETGLRTILNYGHTIGHALETVGRYEMFLHGEAIAIGMVGAAKLAHRLGILSNKVVKEQESILQKYGLPVMTSDVKESDVFTAMELDKKVKSGAIRWVLLKDIGKTTIRANVDMRDVEVVLEELLK